MTRRLMRAVCPLGAPLDWGFGLALVWEGGGQEDREVCSVMVVCLIFQTSRLESNFSSDFLRDQTCEQRKNFR